MFYYQIIRDSMFALLDAKLDTNVEFPVDLFNIVDMTKMSISQYIRILSKWGNYPPAMTKQVEIKHDTQCSRAIRFPCPRERACGLLVCDYAVRINSKELLDFISTRPEYLKDLERLFHEQYIATEDVYSISVVCPQYIPTVNILSTTMGSYADYHHARLVRTLYNCGAIMNSNVYLKPLARGWIDTVRQLIYSGVPLPYNAIAHMRKDTKDVVLLQMLLRVGAVIPRRTPKLCELLQLGDELFSV